MKITTNKKLRKSIAQFIFVAASLFITQSCVKDNFDFKKLSQTDYHPNIAVPLVYSSLTIQDLLTKSNQNLIIVGSDKFCTLVYKGNLFSLNADSVVKIPDNQPPPLSASLSTGQISALGFAGTVMVPYSQTVAFNTGVGGPKIDSVTFKAGSLGLSLNSSFKYSGQIKVIIPSAKKNGVAFTQIIPFTYTGSIPVLSNVNLSLAGYNFDMTIGGTAFNQFVVNFEVTLTGSGAAPLTTDQITINQSLSNMKFAKVFGDIGQQSLSPNVDTVKLSIFKNVLGAATFTLANPTIKLILSNSYGVPITASISQFDGYTSGSPPFAITGSPNPLPIHSPNFSQIGQMLTDSFSLNNSNSNVATVINNTPQYLIYKVTSQTNPLGGTTHSNFVLDTSRFKADMELDLPLYGTAKNFILQDTVPFNVSQTIPSQVESALIRTYNANGFPFDVNMQIYFVDSLYTKLDSLVSPNQIVLKSGTVNSTTGMVTSSTSSTYDATLTKPRLAHLKTSKYLLIRAVANTSNGGTTNVKIYSNYKIDFKLGLQVQVNTKI
jgi:hypothetical protein